MMKPVFIKKELLLRLCLITLVCIPLAIQAQAIKRQCISSYGAVITADNTTFEQTVGQPYCTATVLEQCTALPGFQQPVSLKVESIQPELLNAMNLSVFPNPAAYSVTLRSDKPLENLVINVTDVNGKFIFSDQPAQMQMYDINCATWQNGIYLITIRDEKQNTSLIKLIINK